MRHLTVETMLEHIEGGTVPAGLGEVEMHLAACSRCREQATELGEILSMLAEDGENEPPKEALDWSLALFQPVVRPGRSPVGRVLQFARRVFDSYQEPLEGVRNVGVVPRQLLYRAGPVDVDLRIESEGDRVSLSGQLLTESESFPEHTEVRLESGGTVRFRAETNAIGEFSFEAVPDDTYNLSVDLPEGELRLFCVSRPRAS